MLTLEYRSHFKEKNQKQLKAISFLPDQALSCRVLYSFLSTRNLDVVHIYFASMGGEGRGGEGVQQSTVGKTWRLVHFPMIVSARKLKQRLKNAQKRSKTFKSRIHNVVSTVKNTAKIWLSLYLTECTAAIIFPIQDYKLRSSESDFGKEKIQAKKNSVKKYPRK